MGEKRKLRCTLSCIIVEKRKVIFGRGSCARPRHRITRQEHNCSAKVTAHRDHTYIVLAGLIIACPFLFLFFFAPRVACGQRLWRTFRGVYSRGTLHAYYKRFIGTQSLRIGRRNFFTATVQSIMHLHGRNSLNQPTHVMRTTRAQAHTLYTHVPQQHLKDFEQKKMYFVGVFRLRARIAKNVPT